MKPVFDMHVIWFDHNQIWELIRSIYTDPVHTRLINLDEPKSNLFFAAQEETN